MYSTDNMTDKKVDIEDVYGIIYKIYCYETKKFYIGQTISHFWNSTEERWINHGIHGRFERHKKDSGIFTNIPLYKDMKKYGFDEFVIARVKKVPGNQLHILDRYEEKFIQKYNSIEKGYNKVKKPTLNNATKRLIYDYYGIVPEKRIVDISERKTRCRQTTFKGPLSALLGKEISHAFVTVLRTKGKNNGYRTVLSIVNEKDKIRKDLTKISIDELLEQLEEICDKDVIELSPSVKDIIDGGDGDAYKHQKKLNNIIELTNDREFHEIKCLGAPRQDCKTIFVLFFKYRREINGETKIQSNRISFGGVTYTHEQCEEEIREFVRRAVQYLPNEPMIDLTIFDSETTDEDNK